MDAHLLLNPLLTRDECLLWQTLGPLAIRKPHQALCAQIGRLKDSLSGS